MDWRNASQQYSHLRIGLGILVFILDLFRPAIFVGHPDPTGVIFFSGWVRHTACQFRGWLKCFQVGSDTRRTNLGIGGISATNIPILG